MIDYAVVGSGIGGSSIAAYLSQKGFDVVLFEKEPYLGGCSSSFLHKGFLYNTGATTLAGYEDGHLVKTFLDSLNIQPKLIQSDPAIVVIQNKNSIKRFQDLEKFLQEIEKTFPHPKNREFWTLIHNLSTQFHTNKTHYFKTSSLFAKLLSLLTYTPMFIKYKTFLFKNAREFIKKFFGTISQEYLDFLDYQTLIVAQTTTQETNFFSCALSLGYTFNKNFYVVGGFETLFEQIAANIKDVKRDTNIISIKKMGDHYLLLTHTNESFIAKNLILNSTIYNSKRYFEEKAILDYYKKFEILKNTQSSFMLYMTIKTDKKFHHHYQLIEKERIEHTISKALFVSFSDQTDEFIAPKGHYSLTASIHTDSRYWDDKQSYKSQKQKLQQRLLAIICENLSIEDKEIVQCFSATPKSFQRFINRTQLGGNPMSQKNLFFRLPGNDSPIKGLYHVGDSVYPAQGWPGVMMGVENLKRVLHV